MEVSWGLKTKGLSVRLCRCSSGEWSPYCKRERAAYYILLAEVWHRKGTRIKRPFKFSPIRQRWKSHQPNISHLICHYQVREPQALIRSRKKKARRTTTTTLVVPADSKPVIFLQNPFHVCSRKASSEIFLPKPSIYFNPVTVTCLDLTCLNLYKSHRTYFPFPDERVSLNKRTYEWKRRLARQSLLLHRKL